MDQYPTEEEEYELMYGDELEMLNEMADYNQVNVKKTGNASNNFDMSEPSTSKQNQHQPSQDLFPSSPGLSQISHLNEPVNRRLCFDSPSGTAALTDGMNTKRTASTPITKEMETQRNPLTEILHDSLGNAANRKRRLNALFEDIYCHDEYLNDHILKKQKNEEERDMDLIERILDARKRAGEKIGVLKNNHLDRLEALHQFKIRNLSYSLPKWPFVTIRRSDGERVYVRTHSEEFETNQINEIKLKKNDFSSLLGESKQRVWDGARQIIYKTLISPKKFTPPAITAAPIVIETNLWVEKYRPKNYRDLLSDETTNRCLLQWIKMWDKVVFNKEIKKSIDLKVALNSFNKKTGRFESNGGWRRKNRFNLNTDRDEIGRPIQKVALLCGPPGLGKTTLAHTLARHAGYEVREINASDDRSPEAFQLALENGTQMKSFLNVDNRPNCIILDEIDGAPQASIDFLLKFINGSVGPKKIKKGSKKEEHKFILKRPIICICNDVYTPALRQLRQQAFVVNFPSLASARLAERLMAIANEQKIKTDLCTLLALAEKTGNDIRSCLSMMQFHNGMKKPLTLHDVLGSNIGQKDQHKSLFAVWSSIFQIQRPRRALIDEISDQGEQSKVIALTDMSGATRMQHILDIVHSSGDYERLMQGVFENFLSQKMPDPNMTGVAEAADWFTFSDRIQRSINQLQNYSVYPYLQYGFVMWHFLFSGLAWPNITFPNKGYEVHQKTTTQKMIFTALRKGIGPTIRGVGDGYVLLLEALPFIKKVLCPTLRSVSLQLLTPKERSDLKHAVEIMADLGLTYTQTKQADGTYQYQIEPDIHHLALYDGIPAPSLNYWSRQLIAREVEVEYMRRAIPKMLNNPKKSATTVAPGKTKQSPDLPNHLKTLKPKQVKMSFVKDKITKDFFGRTVTKQAPIPVKEGGSDIIVKSPIWYRYKEGYNNAVRKDVIITDLL